MEFDDLLEEIYETECGDNDYTTLDSEFDSLGGEFDASTLKAA